MSALRVVAGLWWAGSLFVLLLSFAGAVIFPRRFARTACQSDLPPVTAITPVKSLEPDFENNLNSLFKQDYPELEIVIAGGQATSDVLETARQIQTKHPSSRSSLERSNTTVALSPKLNNLWVPISRASTEIILTKDSNIFLNQDDLKSFVRYLAPDVGVVSTILAARCPKSFAAWVEASIINGYQARMLMVTAVAGFGFGCGKIMLFRRSDLERAGGLEQLAGALGEDAALAHIMAGLGLRTVFADRVSYQTLGARQFSQVWERQLRWMLIRRAQVPLAFFGEFLGLALPTAIAGAIASSLLGIGWMTVVAVTLLSWFAVETLLSLLKGWQISLWSGFAFLSREILLCAAWLRAWTTDEVLWSGALCKAYDKSTDAR